MKIGKICRFICIILFVFNYLVTSLSFLLIVKPALMSEDNIHRKNPLKEQAIEDIALAQRTIAFLCSEKVSSKLKNDKEKLRSLCVSLVRYQEHFSEPIELPFGMGLSFEGKLPTPRDYSGLVRLRAMYEFPAKKAPLFSGSLITDPETKKLYCIPGSEPWEYLVKGGSLKESCDTSFEPLPKGYLWIGGLFDVFAQFLDDDAVRRLAACWYFVASESNLSSNDGECDSKEQEPEEKIARAFQFMADKAKNDALESLVNNKLICVYLYY